MGKEEVRKLNKQASNLAKGLLEIGINDFEAKEHKQESIELRL